jgi:peptide-methionine (S)-S-oxide reductase
MRKSLFLGCAFLFATSAAAHEPPRPIPPPSADVSRQAGDSQTLVLSGGCYGGMQGVFEHVRGVKQVVAGFSGLASSGEDELMHSSRDVPSEAVRIQYDPAQLTLGQILQIYFSVAHDPTEVDRQDPDVGPQYRSVIYYGDDQQKKISDAYIAQLQAARVFSGAIATQVEPLVKFRPVAESQQDYVLKHPTSAYVISVDEPRLAAMKILFPALYMDPPLTFSSASN